MESINIIKNIYYYCISINYIPISATCCSFEYVGGLENIWFKKYDFVWNSLKLILKFENKFFKVMKKYINIYNYVLIIIRYKYKKKKKEEEEEFNYFLIL